MHDRPQPCAYGIQDKEVYATLCLQATLNDVVDYKTFFRCNGFSFGNSYDNKMDYTFRSAMRGFQSVVNLPQTGLTSDDLKRARPPRIDLTWRVRPMFRMG